MIATEPVAERHSYLGLGLGAGLAGLALIVVMIILNGPGHFEIDWNSVVFCEAVAVFLLAAAPFVVSFLNGRRFDLLEPAVIFSVTYVMLFAVRPIFVISPWVRYAYEVPNEVIRRLPPLPGPHLALAVAYGLLGLASFQAGYYGTRGPIATWLRLRLATESTWDSRRITRLVVGILVLSLVSLVVFAVAVGSVQNLMTNLGNLRLEVLLGYGYPLLGLAWISNGALMLWVDRLQGSKRRLAPIVALVLYSNAYNLLVGSRSGVYDLWLAMYVAYRYISGRKLGFKKMIVGGMVLVMAFAYDVSIGELRRYQVTGLNVVQTALDEVWRLEPGAFVANLMLQFGECDIFTTILHEGPGVFPFLWGKGFAELFTQAVPRVVWPDKPWPYDVQVGYFAQGIRNALPASLVGELYINFHAPGVIVGMFIFGAACSLLYGQLRGGRADPDFPKRNPGVALVYAFCLPYVLVLLLRSFVPAGSIFLSMAFPVWLAYRYVVRRRPGRAAVPAGSGVVPAVATDAGGA